MRVHLFSLIALLVFLTPIVRAQEVRRPPQQALVQAGKNALAAGAKPVEIAVKESDAEKAIAAALEQKTAFTFIETPLQDALQQLETQHKIPIIVDARALEEIGISLDTTVTAQLKGVSLRSAFRLLLRDLDLTYMVKDEMLQITTAEAAEQNLVIKMYALPGKLATKSDKVVQVAMRTVVPDTWDELGGPSTMAAIDHVVIVSTTSEIHDQLNAFLAMLIQRYAE